jgi:hypothetical protein
MRFVPGCVFTGLASLALTGCEPKPQASAVPPVVAALPAAGPTQQLTAPALSILKHPLAPQCKIEGCCEGHGEVAYVQPDYLIICTDGQPSEICDCHT